METRFAAVVFCWSAFVTSGLAQGVIAPPPLDFFGIPPAFQTTGTNQPGMLPPISTIPPGLQPLAQWGPVQFRPHLLFRFLYGDGIPATPGHQFKTAIEEIYPGLLLQLGNHWNLDYTPTLRFYSSSHFADSTDHSVSLTGGGTYQEWTLGFSQTYASSSQPLVETATQTATEIFSTAVNASYHMSSGMSLELGLAQSFRFVGRNAAGEQLTDSRAWSTMDWLNYQFGPKFGAAVGLGCGYDNLSIGSDMFHEQVQGRLTLRPGEKLNFTASGGVEDRQFLSSDVPDSLTPIFGVTAEYRLFEATTLSLGASRTVSASYFQNQLTEDLVVNASLRQRLFSRFYLDLSGGYRLSSYSATTAGLTVNREDDGTFVNLRLSAQVFKRGTVAVFYQANDNSSNEPGFAYSSTQLGFELGYRF